MHSTPEFVRWRIELIILWDDIIENFNGKQILKNKIKVLLKKMYVKNKNVLYEKRKLSDKKGYVKKKKKIFWKKEWKRKIWFGITIFKKGFPMCVFV